jgi:hypothetical protein
MFESVSVGDDWGGSQGWGLALLKGNRYLRLNDIGELSDERKKGQHHGGISD